MKSISPIKFLTAVGFLLLTLCVNSAYSQNTITPQNAQTDTKDKIAFCADSSNKQKSLGLWKQFNCEIDSTNDCKSDLDKYNTAVDKAKGACNSFEKVSGKNKNTCEARIEACRKKINSGVDPQSGATGTDYLLKSIVGIFGQKNFPKTDPDDIPMDDPDAPTTGPSCTNYKSAEDRKEAKTEKKEVTKEIQRLKEKIADEKKKMNEENAKLREKNADIDVELQKVDETLKKTLNSIDKSKNERRIKINEDIAKAGTSLRNLNSTIVKQKETAETIKFDFKQRMMQFTEDKISDQCQAALNIAKECLIKSSKGQASTDPNCKGLSITSKGAKGTAVLKKKLATVRDACFEQASMAVNKAKFEQGKSLRSIETDIIEKTNQVKDATNEIERKQNDFASINAESDKERTDEEKNAEKQIENYKKKLDQLNKSTQEALALSAEKMQEFQNEINELNTKKVAEKMGILEPEELGTALQDAEDVISVKETARKSAIMSCCPDITAEDRNYNKEEIKKMKPICGQLIQGTYQVDVKGRASTKGTSK